MANVPDNVKKPADRKASARRKAEETAGDYALIERNGHEFRVSNPLDWYLTTSDALSKGDFLGWAREAIHEDDYDEFVKARLRIRDIGDVVGEAAEYFGADLGE